MRILGLDLGIKSLGIALSDELLFLATGKENFMFAENDFPKAIARILEYSREYEIEKIILGHPLRLNGTKSDRTIMIEEFADKLKTVTDIPVILFDERFSTKIATRILIDANVSRKNRKKQKDKMAAQIILQNFLDYNKI